MGRFSHCISRTLVGTLFALLAGLSHSATDRFDYDAGGRLVRRVDPQGLGTDYLYDAAGNIVQVTAPGQALPPSITSGPLPDMRRNEVRSISIAGIALGGLSIRASHPGVVISQVVQSNTTIAFRLGVSAQVPLGLYELTLQGATGAVALPFNVLPELAYSFEPYPIIVAPDNIARRYSLVVGEASLQARTYGISSLAPNSARTNISQISIPAGQTRADFGVIGVAVGAAALRLTNTDFFEPIEAMVSVIQGGSSPSAFSRALHISRGQSIAWPSALGNYSPPVAISRGTQPWNLSSQATFSSALSIERGAALWALAATETRSTLTIQRRVPWSIPNSEVLAVSGAVQLQRQ